MRLFRSLALLLACAALPCHAGVIDVTTGHDEFGENTDKCSLREAIQAARTDTAFGGCAAGTATDVITLHDNYLGYPIDRAGADEDANATGDFDVTGSGTIAVIGEGAKRSTIIGNGLDRVFDVDMASTGTFILSNVTVSGGDAGASVGGAVFAHHGKVSMTKVHLTRNAATRGGAVYVYSNGQETRISQSAITRNVATQLAGGISNLGILTLSSSTIAENTAPDAGGIHSSGTTVDIKNVTVAYNGGSQHAGAVFGDSDTTIDNSIFANNAVVADGGRVAADLYCTSVHSNGYNLYQRKQCTLSPSISSDIQGDPLLGTLVDAGSGVPVNILLPGSPAVDSGAGGTADGAGGHCTSSDQRGVTRYNGCDRGAYEQRYTYTLTSTADAPDSNIGNGVCASTLGGCTLRAALQEASASDELAVIRIPPGEYAVNIPGRDENAGATGDLDIIGVNSAARVLVGDGPDRSIIRASSGDRVFGTSTSSAEQVPIGLFGLRISGGRAVTTQESWSGKGGGMLLLPDGYTTIDNVWFDGNSADEAGGGLYLIQDGGSVRITRSAFTRNAAVGEGGGAFLAQGRRMIVRDSLFADNTSEDFGGGLAFSNSTDVEVAYVTLTGNHTTRSAAGGLALNGDVVLTGVLASGNSDTGTPETTSPDCADIGSGGGSVSKGYNVIANGPSCHLSGDLTGNLIGVDAPMTRVSMIGRPMPWSAPQPTNPAIDHVPYCVQASGLVEVVDQFGTDRPGEDGVDDNCTSGAIEGVSDVIYADGIDSTYPGE